VTDNPRTFVEEFGFTIEEITTAKNATLERANNVMHRAGRRFLSLGAPTASAEFQKIMAKHWSGLFSDAGLATYILQSNDAPHLLQNIDTVAANIFADPVAFRDATAWCLLFAARDASLFTQMNCTAPRSESHLSGGLLEALKHSCRHWSSVIDAALERRSTTLTLEFVDHSILGGEQATGGDFAIIAEVDGRGLPPGTTPHASDRKIVPLLFQAKRYSRPNADVSQKHHERGFQHTLLGRNPCRSAYIFYENETKNLDATKIAAPFPPLLKDVREVAIPTHTAVLEDSCDFATFLMTSFADSQLAPRANSPEEALQMIFEKADPAQLCRLAIISSEANAYGKYLDILNAVGPDESLSINCEV